MRVRLVPPHILWQRNGRRLMAGEQAKCFHIENKVRWCAVSPQLRVASARETVVAAVYFDNRKLTGVEAQPVFRRFAVSGIELAALDEAGVRPRRSADADVAQKKLPGGARPASAPNDGVSPPVREVCVTASVVVEDDAFGLQKAERRNR